MHTIKTTPITSEETSVQMVLSVHEDEARRIKLAANIFGLTETEFIHRSAMLYVESVESDPIPVSVLPHDEFMAFKKEVESPGKIIPGLKRAFEKSKGVFKHDDE